ncbi:hypothetical protein DESUT3_08420 [Desulfuromonas versatilis]|uniref:Uncharacterized protein n=1 Tax=Desulfuromonas versatilis TaxID=2802975 RepID=A0ABM8HTH8_9BACT|nr:hypothetical protein [Desulfuromonas versatilis]BCR03773.1 hypothetical protein DESUT3_08420 [Desulfuromonas versatilis]
MDVVIKPSDLYFKYPKNKENLDIPKFAGKPDKAPFDRDDLYEVIPMFEAVLSEVGTNDGRHLQFLEEFLTYNVPSFVKTREEIFDCLVESLREILD